MAFTNILRRTCSSVVPLTRAIRTQRNYSSAIFTHLRNNTNKSVSQELLRRASVPALHFSSLAKTTNSNLVQILESEIGCAEEEDDSNQVEGLPNGFPFKIRDEPGMKTIILEKEYEGEVIKVEVHTPEIYENEDEDENNGDGDGEKEGHASIALVVKVTKGRNGTSLEFGCTADPDEITIDSLIVKDHDTSEDDLAYGGPDFQDLDENLQKGFYKYLEVRGIKPSTTNFLYEYMMKKDGKEYLRWLKNVKKFVEK
ncbi:hypothetical protein IFM89_021186 [Coptis chinensis]|uniref:Mitochondrial glycoprotein n=1 Tax=Coptis chinensis TaxID=261450 RepID=A0A835LNA3_9MAGN|nr:hypothetical protein IFM89_021186 [Coptis chinensis]